MYIKKSRKHNIIINRFTSKSVYVGFFSITANIFIAWLNIILIITIIIEISKAIE